jgi:hypothetical protein
VRDPGRASYAGAAGYAHEQQAAPLPGRSPRRGERVLAPSEVHPFRPALASNNLATPDAGPDPRRFTFALSLYVHIRKDGNMLWTIFVILLVLWLLGMVTSYTMGGFIHILLLLAIAVVLIRVIQGRRPVA